MQQEKQISEIVAQQVEQKLQQIRRRQQKKLALLALLLPVTFWAASIVKPHTYKDGDILSATSLNENFDILFNKVNELNAKVTAEFKFIKGSSDYTFNTTLSDVPQAAITITTDGAPIKISFWMAYSNVSTVNQISEFQLYRGTTLIRTWRTEQANNDITKETSLVWVDEPAAGTFTYKIMARTLNNTARRDAATNSQHGSILIAEVIKK